jgi:hypothetical protein
MVSSGGNPDPDEWKDFDFSTVKIEKPRATRPLPRREIVRLIIIGLVGGALVWILRLMLESWVLSPLFCRTPDTASICANAGSTAFVMSLIIVGSVAVSLLVSTRVFRPVLVTLATFVSLGALWFILDSRSAILATLLSAIFGALLYLFFALVAAVKRYLLAIILMVALTIAFWLLARA